MWKTLRQIARAGIATEPAPEMSPEASSAVTPEAPSDVTPRAPSTVTPEVGRGGDEAVAPTPDRIQRELLAILGRALAIRHLDAGSCNGCELEIQALANPYYNIEGLGIRFVASPRHADLLLVTGPVSRHMATALRRTFDATPEPRLVVAIGDCGACGGIFGEPGYATCGRVANVIPVDVVVAGCPPSPAAILRGILAAVRRAPRTQTPGRADRP